MAPLLTPRDAALRLGISYPTMKQWLYQGKIRATRILTLDADLRRLAPDLKARIVVL